MCDKCSPVCKHWPYPKARFRQRAIRELILTRSVGVLKFSPQALKRLRAGGGGLRADLRSACLGEPPKAPVLSFLLTLPHSLSLSLYPPLYTCLCLCLCQCRSLSLSLSASLSLALSLALSAIYLHSLGQKVNPERMLYARVRVCVCVGLSCEHAPTGLVPILRFKALPRFGGASLLEKAEKLRSVVVRCLLRYTLRTV